MCSQGSVRAEYSTETQLESLSRALKTRTMAYSKAKAGGAPVAWQNSACAVLVNSAQTDAATGSAQTRTLSQLPNRSTIQQCSEEYGTSVHDSSTMEEVRAIRGFTVSFSGLIVGVQLQLTVGSIAYLEYSWWFC